MARQCANPMHAHAALRAPGLALARTGGRHTDRDHRAAVGRYLSARGDATGYDVGDGARIDLQCAPCHPSAERATVAVGEVPGQVEPCMDVLADVCRLLPRGVDDSDRRGVADHAVAAALRTRA